MRLEKEMELSKIDRAAVWSMWVQRERNHLRETRLAKAQSITALAHKTRSLADFDIVKVLGKGSFGVVRLVRERGQG